jgi:colanic acid/amylovoran biosynthesis glycosyltransferase
VEAAWSPVHDDRPTVAHVTRTFIQVTESWIYDQIRFAGAVRGVVLARSRRNAADFPWEPVHLPGSGLGRVGGRLAQWLLGYRPEHLRAARIEAVRLVHAHFGHTGVKSLGLARSLNVPLVTSFYGVDLWKERRRGALMRRYRRLFGEGAAFVAEGPAARLRLLELGAPPQRTHVHRLGVDVDAIPFEPRSHDGRFRVLMAARFAEKKGLEYGVEAFCRVARARAAMQLTIVGGAGDRKGREIEARLRSLVAEWGLAERVDFTGFISRQALQELAASHHVLLHPSVTASNGDREGGHPVVLTQAAATGLPSIATLHCDIPEIVRDGESGWLVPERDVHSLVEALNATAEDPQELARRGAAARRLVESRYDARRQTLDSLYLSLIS